MSSKMAMAESKRNRLYKLGIIFLSSAVIIVLLVTFIPRMTGTKNGTIDSKAQTNLTDGFECTVNAKYNGSDYELLLKKPENSGYTMTFVKPDNLSSLSFEATDEGLKVKKGALEIVVDASSIPQKSVYDAIIGAFDSCMKENVSVNPTGEDTVVSGKSPAGDFTMTFDSSMKPKSISIPSLKVSAEISNFKSIK